MQGLGATKIVKELQQLVTEGIRECLPVRSNEPSQFIS